MYVCVCPYLFIQRKFKVTFVVKMENSGKAGKSNKQILDVI